MGAEFGDTREKGCAFQLELKEVNGLESRLFEFMEAMRCSLALRDALVSRANLGVESNLEVEGGVEDCVGESIGGVTRL
jgi:hypothetical protein